MYHKIWIEIVEFSHISSRGSFDRQISQIFPFLPVEKLCYFKNSKSFLNGIYHSPILSGFVSTPIPNKLRNGLIHSGGLFLLGPSFI